MDGFAFARHGDAALAGVAPTGGDIEVAAIRVQFAERGADDPYGA
jgi:hypothetical protein